MAARGQPVLYGNQTVPPALAGGAAPAPRGGGGVIGGSLPWSGGGGSMFSGGAAGLGASYNSAYNSALAMNQQNYGNILQGYQQADRQQRRGLNDVSAGYDTLSKDVLAGIAGTDASAKQQIEDSYAQQQGSATQGLVNAGLGNSTVTSAVGRGLQYDREKSYTSLANQMAQLSAGYQSQLGQAGLGFKGNAVLANSQLAQNQLGWMNSVNAQYPDAGAYSQMAQMYAAQSQAEADRKRMMDAYSGMGGGGFNGGQPGGTPGLGYVPQRAPTVGMGGGTSGGGYGVSSPAPQAPPQFFNPYAGSSGGNTTATAPSFGTGMGGAYAAGAGAGAAGAMGGGFTGGYGGGFDAGIGAAGAGAYDNPNGDYGDYSGYGGYAGYYNAAGEYGGGGDF